MSPRENTGDKHEVGLIVESDLFHEMVWVARCLTCPWFQSFHGIEPGAAEANARRAADYHHRYARS